MKGDRPVEVVSVVLCGDGKQTVIERRHTMEVTVLLLPLHVHLPQFVRPEVQAGRRHGPLKQAATTTTHTPRHSTPRDGKLDILAIEKNKWHY